jgi:DNA-binding PadR family transcriptional regulator
MVATDGSQKEPNGGGNKKDDQKTALIKALRKPMTGTELLEAMCEECPNAQLRDIWRLLKNLEKRGLVYCLTPEEITGRLYFFTEKGLEMARNNYDISIDPSPPLDWKKYSQVVRGLARKAVLMAIGSSPLLSETLEPKTATQVRKYLVNHKQPMGLGGTIRAIHELERMGLVHRVGVTSKRSCPLYLPTEEGRKFIDQIKGPTPKKKSS